MFVRKPVFGMPIDSAEVTRSSPMALVFLRYAGSAHTRRTAVDLHAVWADLDHQDVRLVVVTEGSVKAVNDFVPRYHLLYPVLHDATGELYDAYQVPRDRAYVKTLLALRPWIVRDYVSSLSAGHGSFDGPFDRMPAAFVIAPGGALSWTWYGRSPMDQLDVHAFADAALGAVRQRAAS